jgi:hypothetical protein
MSETVQQFVDPRDVSAPTDGRQGQQSIDLGADPATTHDQVEAADAAPSERELARPLAGLTADQLRQYRPEVIEQIVSEQESIGGNDQVSRTAAAL